MNAATAVRQAAAAASALLLALGAAHAGRPCAEPKPMQLATVERALKLAERTWQTLEHSGARVVVLGRAGQDLSKYGLRYSHLGFAYQQPDGMGGHLWRVLHKLNQCGTAEAAIYRQGLGEFFLDDLWQYEAAWVVPTPEVQDKLQALLADEQRAIRLNIKPYSMVSYVWGGKYQQSNQWATETLALALSADLAATPNPTRQQAQAWLQLKDYQPTTLKIDALTRLGARITAANVAFDDHPNDKRYADQIETVTVDSVFDWMLRAGLSGQPVVTLR
jgi:hypothetical protein